MTKRQKNTLIVLIVIAMFLAVGLIVLYEQEKEIPDLEINTIADATQLPIIKVMISLGSAVEEPPIQTNDPFAAATYNPDQPELSMEPTASADSTKPNPIATLSPAYVRMPTAEPAVTPIPTVPNGMAFTLSILGKTVNVTSNVNADTLEKTPGWLPTSAKPGEEGVCIVYGHRNRKHLQILKEVEIGDEIDAILANGKVYTYIVKEIEILEKDEALQIPTIDGKQLFLMTCYPFYYTGHAPQKIVVTCMIAET